MSKEGKPFAHAMAFYHQDGLSAAWKQAMKFAGKGGRLATMPDIVAAWLATGINETAWATYSTTLSAEYLGFSKQGNRILIIAHGIGPLSTLEGIQKAYSWEYKDKERNRHGGRITQEVFWELEAGKFGEVSIVDFESYRPRYKYPFMQFLRVTEALTDPLLKARLGEAAEQYVLAHANHARKWHLEQAGITPENRYNIPDNIHRPYLHRRLDQHLNDGAQSGDPYIISLKDPGNNCYTFGPEHGHRKIEDGLAFAHLISAGCLCECHHEGHESLVHDVGCFEWWNGVRLVGIQEKGAVLSGINSGPDAYDLLRKHWVDLFEPVKNPEHLGFRRLIKLGKQWFTEFPKKGCGLDTADPEYQVTSINKVGKPVLFRTEVKGYYGFFKYCVQDVKAMASPEANAYCFVSEPHLEDGAESQTAMVQFYRVEADTSKRLIRADQLCHDYDTMMSLLAKEKVA